jgi:hypothetical protein
VVSIVFSLTGRLCLPWPGERPPSAGTRLWTGCGKPRGGRTKLDFRPMSRARITGYVLPNAARAGRGLRRGGGRAPVRRSPDSSAVAGRGRTGIRAPIRGPSSVQLPLLVRGLAFLACNCPQEGHTLVQRAEASTLKSQGELDCGGRGSRRDATPSRCYVKTIGSAGGTATTLPRIQKCSCDGSGWFVSLNRDRYRSPGDAGMLQLRRCLCLERAPSPVRRGGAGAV